MTCKIIWLRLNLFFTIVFTTEMVLKIIVLNPKGYIRDYLNIIDGIIVIISLMDLGIKILKL